MKHVLSSINYYKCILNTLQDTRLPEEYETGHIPGSVHVNFKSDAEEIIANVPQLQEAGEFWMNSAFNAGGQELVQSGTLIHCCLS